MPVWYRQDKRPEIKTLLWLVGYYEGRAHLNPKDFLARLIQEMIEPDDKIWGDRRTLAREVYVLFHWVNEGEIRGF